MLSKEQATHPIVHHLVLITKKYLSTFADLTIDIPLDRYHYALLYIYQNNEKLTQQDLADYFKVDKSFMVNMIDYLVKKGFVYRKTDLDDRRKHLIKLTKKAHQFLPEINDALVKTNKKALELVTNEQLEVFWKVIQQIEVNLNIESQHNISIDFIKTKI
ncbi:MAG TPA: MarR family transcriptional regulator [Pelobium sp.]